ncbi:MAG: zinc dependent phospholipase C family protein [Aliishimia sp.]
MFIAHLPAAYLVSRAFPNLSQRPLLIGSVLPDLDLLLVYVGGVAQHHHNFLSHRPALWIALMIAGFAAQSPWVRALALGAIVHVLLDTVAGQIAWAWPLSSWTMPVVTVPARYEYWVWNFILHWSFLIELVICAGALYQLKNPRR